MEIDMLRQRDRKPVGEILLWLPPQSLLCTELRAPPVIHGRTIELRVIGNAIFLKLFEQLDKPVAPGAFEPDGVDSGKLNGHIAVGEIVDVQWDDEIFEFVFFGDALR